MAEGDAALRQAVGEPEAVGTLKRPTEARSAAPRASRVSAPTSTGGTSITASPDAGAPAGSGGAFMCSWGDWELERGSAVSKKTRRNAGTSKP